MAQTVSNITKVLKEVWTADTLEKQFYNDFPILDRLEKTDKYTIGKEAEVPVHTGRSGNTTVLGSAGGSMNSADAQKVDRGTFGLAYNYGPIKIELGAINQASGGSTSVIDALELEVAGGTDDLRKDVTRQFLGNGDALIAKCTTSSSGQTVLSLDPAGYGYEAIVRGWLRAGQTIDVGTTASQTAVGGGLVIASVQESSSAPSVTLTTNLANAASTSHFVSIANARAGTTSNESIGFRTAFGSASTVVGGLDPASATYWQPAYVDSTTTTLSLDVPLTIQRKVFQKSGKMPMYTLTGIYQLTNFYSILQNQVRFTGDIEEAGNVLRCKWAGQTIEAIPDASDREWYMYDPSKILLVTGKFSKPTWMSSIEGVNQGLVWTPGATAFQDAIFYGVGLAIRRRNVAGSAVNLTA